MAEEKPKDKKEEKGKGKGAAGEDAAAEGEGDKKKKPLVFKIILFSSLAIVLIAVVVLVSWKVASMQADPYKDNKPDKQDEERSKKSYTTLSGFKLGSKENPDFKMVITDRGEQHNLKCTIFLGYSKDYDAKGPEFKKELEERIPMLREIVYRVMAGKTLEELQIRSMDRIEEELLSRINEVLEHGSIVDIMFDEYIIQ